MPGFNTLQRTGIELTGTFTATINVEMRVGGLEETVTVTGEAPVVDVQSVNRQRVLTREVMDAIPAGRSHLDVAALVPGLQVNASGTRGTLADVGGTNNLQNMTLTMHGGRSYDTRLMVDGIRIGNAGSGGEFTNYVPDMGSTQELVIDYAAITAEQMTGGVRLNYVPKDGGNTPSGSVFATGVNDKFQSDNLDDELVARGLTTPNKMKLAYDVNAGVGGPIKRDKLWFYSAVRWQDNESLVAGGYTNKNAGNNNSLDLRCRITSQPAVFFTKQKNVNARLTYQANQKNKITLFGDNQWRDWDDARPIHAPEAMTQYNFPRLFITQAGWTSTLSNRLLLEARLQVKGECYRRLRAARRDHPGLRAVHRLLLPRQRAVVRQPGRRVGQRRAPHRPEPADLARQRVLRHRRALVQGGLQPHAGEVRRRPTLDVDQNIGYQFNQGMPDLRSTSAPRRSSTAATRWPPSWVSSRRTAGPSTG